MNRFVFQRLSGYQYLEAFYQEFLPQLGQPRFRDIVFEFPKLDFFPPEALMSLACASRLWHRAAGGVVEWRIETENVLRYVERMDTLTVFGDCIRVPALPSDLWFRGASSKLMELMPLSNDPEQNSLNDVPLIISAAQKLMLGRIPTQKIGAATSLLSEVGQNITHSGSQGYALMQLYETTAQGDRVHIAVGDTGRGIPDSLRNKYPNMGQASDYLKKALESGISSRNVGNGLGLYQVQYLVRNGGGTLTIRSDSAMLQIYDGRVYQWDNLPYLPGTQVFITIWGKHAHDTWNYLLSMPQT